MGSNPIPSAILRRKFPQFINVLCGSLLSCPAPFLSNALSAGGRHRRPRWVQRSVVRGKRRNSGLAGIRRSPSGRPATKRTRTNGESNRARTFGPRSAWRQLSQRCRPSRRPQARCSPCTAYLAQRKARGSVGINPGSLCRSGDRAPPGRRDCRRGRAAGVDADLYGEARDSPAGETADQGSHALGDCASGGRYGGGVSLNAWTKLNPKGGEMYA